MHTMITSKGQITTEFDVCRGGAFDFDLFQSQLVGEFCSGRPRLDCTVIWLNTNLRIIRVKNHLKVLI